MTEIISPLSLERTHDFQLFLSPQDEQTCGINPPSFNWPQKEHQQSYRLELQKLDGTSKVWSWDNVTSPFQLSETLSQGNYRWRVTDPHQKTSVWFRFTIDATSEEYLPPQAKDLFERCEDKDQFLLYFDQDLETIRHYSSRQYQTLKRTAKLVDIEAIHYQTHYRRGQEEGKRTAIANVRNWIDRDLIALALLYKVWQDQQAGEKAIQVLLRLAEWSPEGPASLLRPCTWGDEVGLSLARNVFLAYHWLSPLLTDSEKQFITPTLVRIAYQMEQRLNEDNFKQYPGHSHTSRLPSYLGIAGLVLHKEYPIQECERWLNYALMIYRGVLPFYGGNDGSWAEGAFYSSSYTKWHHPFFLAVERLSGFSFYNHPFYKNYCHFAMDFVATDDVIHPFGDGFWCRRDGKEWPGFFAQNPLRIYADRFGTTKMRETSERLEQQIDTYALHLLDAVPTITQLEFAHSQASGENQQQKSLDHTFYSFAGFGKASAVDHAQQGLSLYYRASSFGNSSHRHGDQGNFALIDKGINVLTPTGSYGYRFGSQHHSQWTRTTQAHNLPLIDQQGQILDDKSATANVLWQHNTQHYAIVQMDLSRCYPNIKSYKRTLIFVAGAGLIIYDDIHLPTDLPVQWRLHSPLVAKQSKEGVILENQYRICLLNQPENKANIQYGYQEDRTHNESISSDASDDIYHLEWRLPKCHHHQILAACSPKSTRYQLDESRLQIQLDEVFLTIDTRTGEVTTPTNRLENSIVEESI